MSRSIIRMILALALTASALPAHADWSGLGLDNVKPPEMKYGPIEIHPYLKLAETYDSNIYLMPRSKVAGQNANNNTAGPVLGSWIHTVNPGVKIAAQLAEMHRVDLSYDGQYLAYSKQPKLNNTYNQGVIAAYTYRGPMGLSARAKNDYLNTMTQATSEITQRVRRWQNTASLEGIYAPEGGWLYAAVDAQQTTHKYVKDPTLGALLNRYEQSAGFKVGYQLQPKTRAYIGYHRQVIHYTAKPASPTKNNKGHLLDFGVEGDIAPKLTGQIQTGLQYRNYDDAPFAGGKRVTRNWMVATKLRYMPLERTKVDLALSRSLQEATFGQNQFYIASTANLGVSHKLPWKLTASGNVGFEQNKYPEATTVGTISVSRRDDIYQAGANLDYDIQEWLKAGIGYQNRKRWSKSLTEQFNYVDHQTTLSLAATF